MALSGCSPPPLLGLAEQNVERQVLQTQCRRLEAQHYSLSLTAEQLSHSMAVSGAGAPNPCQAPNPLGTQNQQGTQHSGHPTPRAPKLTKAPNLLGHPTPWAPNSCEAPNPLGTHLLGTHFLGTQPPGHPTPLRDPTPWAPSLLGTQPSGHPTLGHSTFWSPKPCKALNLLGIRPQQGTQPPGHSESARHPTCWALNPPGTQPPGHSTPRAPTS